MAPVGPHCPQEMSPGPTSCVLWQSYTEWLQELREKGPELLKPPPASTEPSSVSTGADTHPCQGRRGHFCCPLSLGREGARSCLIRQLGETFVLG